jgi:hypothetical protein
VCSVKLGATAIGSSVALIGAVFCCSIIGSFSATYSVAAQ